MGGAEGRSERNGAAEFGGGGRGVALLAQRGAEIVMSFDVGRRSEKVAAEGGDGVGRISILKIGAAEGLVEGRETGIGAGGLFQLPHSFGGIAFV